MESITDLIQDENIVKFSHALFSSYSQDRMKWDRFSIENHKFREGDHYNYNRFSPSSTSLSYPNKFQRKVMLSTVLIESKKNMVLSSNPTPMISPLIDPTNLDQSKVIAMATQNLVQDILASENFTYKVAKVIDDGLTDNVGYLELTNDESGIHIGTHPFKNIYIPSNLENIKDAPIIGKRFKGIIGQYKTNPLYKNMDKIHGKNRLETSQDFWQMGKSPLNDFRNPIDDLNDFEAMEWQCIFTLNEKTIKRLSNKYKWIQHKEVGDKIMRLFTVAGDHCIRDEYIDTDSYYIYAYNTLGGALYQQSIFRRLMSLNKAYDNVWSMIEEYIAYAVRYRILVERNSLVTPITNSNGLKILYEGEPPVEMKHSDINPGIFQMLTKYEQTMQSIISVSDSSMGEMASGSKKFKAMETQKQQDIFNTMPLIANLKMTIKQLTEGVLDMVENSYDLRNYVYQDTSGIHTVKLTGKKYAEHNSLAMMAQNKDELVIVKKEYPVSIKVANGLDYTENSQQAQLFELATTAVPQGGGMIPLKVYLDSLDETLASRVDQAQREEAQTPAQPLKPGEQLPPAPEGAMPQGGQTPPQATQIPQAPEQAPQAAAPSPTPMPPHMQGSINAPTSPMTPHPHQIMTNVQDILMNHPGATNQNQVTKKSSSKSKSPKKKVTLKV